MITTHSVVITRQNVATGETSTVSLPCADLKEAEHVKSLLRIGSVSVGVEDGEIVRHKTLSAELGVIQ